MILLASYNFDTMIKKLAFQFSKFASVGGVCATFNLTCIFVLLKFFHTPLTLTYVVISCCSILLSFFLNSYFTFKNVINLQNLIRYYMVYLSSMILGVIVLNLYNYYLDFEVWIYPFMVVPVKMVWNFNFVSRLIEAK